MGSSVTVLSDVCQVHGIKIEIQSKNLLSSKSAYSEIKDSVYCQMPSFTLYTKH